MGPRTRAPPTTAPQVPVSPSCHGWGPFHRRPPSGSIDAPGSQGPGWSSARLFRAVTQLIVREHVGSLSRPPPSPIRVGWEKAGALLRRTRASTKPLLGAARPRGWAGTLGAQHGTRWVGHPTAPVYLPDGPVSPGCHASPRACGAGCSWPQCSEAVTSSPMSSSPSEGPGTQSTEGVMMLMIPAASVPYRLQHALTCCTVQGRRPRSRSERALGSMPGTSGSAAHAERSESPAARRYAFICTPTCTSSSVMPRTYTAPCTGSRP